MQGHVIVFTVRMLILCILLIVGLTIISAQNRRTGIHRRPIGGSTTRTPAPTAHATEDTTPYTLSSSSSVSSTEVELTSTSSSVSSDVLEGHRNDCLKGAANTCFRAVPPTFARIVHTNQPNQTVDSVVENVCSAVTAALHCTQTVIHRECSIEHGRIGFESWTDAINDTLQFACKINRPISTVLVNQSKCWNFDSFSNCIGKNSDIRSVQDLFETKLTAESCRKLDDAFANCNDEIPNQANDPNTKCTPTNYHLTSLAIAKLLHHFLSNSYCRVFLDFGIDSNESNETGPGDLEPDADYPKVQGDSRMLPHNSTDDPESSNGVNDDPSPFTKSASSVVTSSPNASTSGATTSVLAFALQCSIATLVAARTGRWLCLH